MNSNLALIAKTQSLIAAGDIVGAESALVELADAEGDGVDVIDLDADEARAELLSRHRPDRPAGVGAVQDKPEQAGDGERGGEADHPRRREEERPELDHLERGIGIERAGVGAEEREEPVLQHDRQAERDEQHVVVVAVARRADDEALEAVAEAEHQGHDPDHRPIGIDVDQSEGAPDREHRDGEQRPVREVDDVQHPVDQGQPEGDEGVDRPRHQAVEGRLDQDLGRVHRHALSGKLALVSAKASGAITLTSPPWTWVLSGSALVFWPVSNFDWP